MDMKYTHFGRCLRIAQTIRGVKNIDLAKELGVKPQQIIRLRNAEDFSMHRVEWLASYFSMTVSEFMGLDHAGS
jgi:transcriptional regulator with XRE-family HTH domain